MWQQMPVRSAAHDLVTRTRRKNTREQKKSAVASTRVRGPFRMEKDVRGSPDLSSDTAKLRTPNERAAPRPTRAARRVILPGDSRLMAPNTSVGGTMNPNSV